MAGLLAILQHQSPPEDQWEHCTLHLSAAETLLSRYRLEHMVAIRRELRIPARLSTAGVVLYYWASRKHLVVVVVVRMRLEMQRFGKVKPEKHLRQPARFVAENCFVVVRLVFHLE